MAAKKQTPAKPLPEWLNTTPVMSYELLACDYAEGTEQRVKLSFGEFELLKHLLARARGFDVSESLAAVVTSYKFEKLAAQPIPTRRRTVKEAA